MKKSWVFILLFTLFFFIDGCNIAFCQCSVVKRVKIISGGSVPFIFSTISKYESGISYNNWSRINVFFDTTCVSSNDHSITGWKLYVRANDAVVSSDAGFMLPLKVLKIVPWTDIAGATMTTVILSAVDVPIVECANPDGSGDVLLRFDCGKDSTLLGKKPDYYYIDLVFTLKEVP